MTKTLTKTAAALFAAAFATAGVAFADDATLTEKIYAKMDAEQAQTFELVTISAEERISKLTAAAGDTDAADEAESLPLASS